MEDKILKIQEGCKRLAAERRIQELLAKKPQAQQNKNLFEKVSENILSVFDGKTPTFPHLQDVSSEKK